MLDRPHRAALSHEIDAASTLLRHGHAILAEYRFASRDAEAVFVCLAGGAEKLLKLTFGLIKLDDEAKWPPQATMRKANHRITHLDEEVRGLIAARQERSTVPALMSVLIEWADGDPGSSLLLTTLERYATNGRFYNLDLLGGYQQGESPQALWRELEDLVVDANPELLEQLAGDAYDAARLTMNRVIALSFGAWCELIYRAWTTGVCGEEARAWSAQLDLGHEVPAAIERKLRDM